MHLSILASFFLVTSMVCILWCIRGIKYLCRTFNSCHGLRGLFITRDSISSRFAGVGAFTAVYVYEYSRYFSWDDTPIVGTGYSLICNNASVSTTRLLVPGTRRKWEAAHLDIFTSKLCRAKKVSITFIWFCITVEFGAVITILSANARAVIFVPLLLILSLATNFFKKSCSTKLNKNPDIGSSCFMPGSIRIGSSQYVS